MKTVFFTGIAVLFLLSANAQLTIPNAGFENWTAAGSYENPDSWDSPNDVTSSLGKIVVEKEETYVHSGNYAAMITVQSSFAGNLPGMLTLGDFSFDLLSMTATIAGGIPFSGRPEKFTGWYQYDPQNSDICLMGAFLLKDNAGVWDTVAIAGFESTASVTAWTAFEADFDYRSSETPTHMNIILMPTDRNNPQANSTIYIDDLGFTYPVSVDDQEKNNFQAYANTENNRIDVLFPSETRGTLTLRDMQGRIVHSSIISSTASSIDMQQVTAGIYLITFESEKAVYSIKTIWPEKY